MPWRLIGTIASALLILLGALWILQGLGVLPFGVMAGQMRWAIYGAVLAVGGLALLWQSRMGKF